MAKLRNCKKFNCEQLRSAKDSGGVLCEIFDIRSAIGERLVRETSEDFKRRGVFIQSYCNMDVALLGLLRHWRNWCHKAHHKKEEESCKRDSLPSCAKTYCACAWALSTELSESWSQSFWFCNAAGLMLATHNSVARAKQITLLISFSVKHQRNKKTFLRTW